MGRGGKDEALVRADGDGDDRWLMSEQRDARADDGLACVSDTRRSPWDAWGPSNWASEGPAGRMDQALHRWFGGGGRRRCREAGRTASLVSRRDSSGGASSRAWMLADTGGDVEILCTLENVPPSGQGTARARARVASFCRWTTGAAQTEPQGLGGIAQRKRRNDAETAKTRAGRCPAWHGPAWHGMGRSFSNFWRLVSPTFLQLARVADGNKLEYCDIFGGVLSASEVGYFKGTKTGIAWMLPSAACIVAGRTWEARRRWRVTAAGHPGCPKVGGILHGIVPGGEKPKKDAKLPQAVPLLYILPSKLLPQHTSDAPRAASGCWHESI